MATTPPHAPPDPGQPRRPAARDTSLVVENRPTCGAADAIRTALTDPTLRDNANRLAAQLATEDGAAAAVTAVESRID